MNGRDFPELSAADVAGAKLYATRFDLVADLQLPRGGRIAEIGVALGSFSKFMIEKFQPASFYAFDLFRIHHDEYLWGKKTSEVLNGMSHLEFYLNEMKGSSAQVIAEEGLSVSTLPRYLDEFFDMVYIDASHTYEDVKADAALAAQKVTKDGILVFNDYVLHDPFINAPYGVVPAVNELITEGGWKVIGFALQKHMFCDIAIQRR